MKKYVCSICGYIYDEADGRPGDGIAPGTPFAGLPETWTCPVCGAAKEDFYAMEEAGSAPTEAAGSDPDTAMASSPDAGTGTGWSAGALSVIFSNLAKGSEKQYLPAQAGKFQELSNYFLDKAGTSTGANTQPPSEDAPFAAFKSALAEDVAGGYAAANKPAAVNPDRGALRALVWGEKVSKVQTAILSRYEKKKAETLKETNLYVCEICGFIYIGEDPPDICPVCKVPSLKIRKMA
jgi:rubredoxin